MCTSHVVWKPNGEVKARLQDPSPGCTAVPPFLSGLGGAGVYMLGPERW